MPPPRLSRQARIFPAARNGQRGIPENVPAVFVWQPVSGTPYAADGCELGNQIAAQDGFAARSGRGGQFTDYRSGALHPELRPQTRSAFPGPSHSQCVPCHTGAQPGRRADIVQRAGHGIGKREAGKEQQELQDERQNAAERIARQERRVEDAAREGVKEITKEQRELEEAKREEARRNEEARRDNVTPVTPVTPPILPPE